MMHGRENSLVDHPGLMHLTGDFVKLEQEDHGSGVQYAHTKTVTETCKSKK